MSFLKALWANPKVRVAVLVLVGALVEHFTGALSSVIG